MMQIQIVNGSFRFTTKVYFLPESKLSYSVNNITSKTAWMLTSSLNENNVNIACIHQKIWWGLWLLLNGSQTFLRRCTLAQCWKSGCTKFEISSNCLDVSRAMQSCQSSWSVKTHAEAKGSRNWLCPTKCEFKRVLNSLKTASTKVESYMSE